MPVPMNGEDLKELDGWKNRRDAIEQQCLNALETFTTVNQIHDLWPEALKLVPDYLVEPEKYFRIP